MAEGSRVAILGYGTIVQQCMDAAKMLKTRDVEITVADARFCKPLDTELIRQLVNEHEILITVEEGAIGGFGSHVSQFLGLSGLLDGPLKVCLKNRDLIAVREQTFLLTILSFSFCLPLIVLDMCLQLRSMVLPDRYIDHGSPQDQIEEAGLSSKQISATVLSLLGMPKEAFRLK